MPEEGLDWLQNKQHPKFGYWAADSLNKRHDSGSMPEVFSATQQSRLRFWR